MNTLKTWIIHKLGGVTPEEPRPVLFKTVTCRPLRLGTSVVVDAKSAHNAWTKDWVEKNLTENIAVKIREKGLLKIESLPGLYGNREYTATLYVYNPWDAREAEKNERSGS